MIATWRHKMEVEKRARYRSARKEKRESVKATQDPAQPPEDNTGFTLFNPSLIDDLPNETLELIFAKMDGWQVAICRQVCRKWHRLIDAAPWDVLPKVHYKTMMVSAQRGLEVTLWKYADEAMPGDKEGEEKEESEPSSKKARLNLAGLSIAHQSSELSKERRILKQNREGLTRTRVDNMLKITDRPTGPDMPFLMKFFRHVSAEKLILQSLSGKGLMTMLLIFKRMCLRTKTVVLDFCNFSDIRKQMFFDFLKPRLGLLTEFQFSSCRDLDKSFSPDDFLTAVWPLKGPFATIRLKDHYANSPWKDELATKLLALDSPPWLLDLDGVSVDRDAVHRYIINWYCGDPTLASSPKLAGKKKTWAPPGCKTDVQTQAPETREEAWLKTWTEEPWKPRNSVLKFDNCRGIRLGRFWNETQRQVLEPHDIRIQPNLSKVLEPSFDGVNRSSAHRNRMSLTRPDGAYLHIYLQR